ncbi:hypothetical protein D3C73_806510 [compost metagenome]
MAFCVRSIRLVYTGRLDFELAGLLLSTGFDCTTGGSKVIYPTRISGAGDCYYYWYNISVGAAAFCVLGGLIFLLYNEKRVVGVLEGEK